MGSDPGRGTGEVAAMSLPIIFRPEARAEFDEAYDWYEGQHAGLGEKFARASSTSAQPYRSHASNTCGGVWRCPQGGGRALPVLRILPRGGIVRACSVRVSYQP